jgi:CRISPR-associated exonuclease Cas4
MLLEDEYNKPVRYGFIYIDQGEVTPVEITPNARVYVKETLDKIRLLVLRESMPGKAREKGKCIDCEYRNFCGDVR